MISVPFLISVTGLYRMKYAVIKIEGHVSFAEKVRGLLVSSANITCHEKMKLGNNI